MEITYGHRIKTDDDPYLHLAREVDRMLNGAGNAGASIVDFFPFRMSTLGSSMICGTHSLEP